MKNTISKGTMNIMTTMNTQFHFTNVFTNLFTRVTRARLNNILRLATLAAACLALPTHALAQSTCPEDLDGSGVVDSGDVGLVLLASGECPAPTPSITLVNPSSGSTAGFTSITIVGTNFTGASSVLVGGVYATSFVVVSATTITAITPSRPSGVVDIVLSTPVETITLAKAFTYVATGSWYTILEQAPNAAVVPDAAVRAKIVSSGNPWRVRDNSTGIEMLFVPHGTFQMGASPGDLQAYPSESPTHQVTLTKGFYLGKTEVTEAQWLAKMGPNTSASNTSSGDFSEQTFPVSNVSWNDVQGFNGVTGLRLPTGAEWEYACRGGSTASRYGVLDDIAMYSGQEGRVASKAANAFGMYDMLGNLSEWCNDWFGSYAASNATDPAGPSTGEFREIRGGDFELGAWSCRSSYREWWTTDERHFAIGFRVARNP